MSIVLLFGSFDILHPGHRALFAQAKEHGEELHVIVARDATIAQIKGRPPYFSQEERCRQLQEEPLVDVVHLGAEGDKYAHARTLAPDVIVLGYDQEAFIDGLLREIATWPRAPRVIRALPHAPDRCKSSLLRAQREAGDVAPR